MILYGLNSIEWEALKARVRKRDNYTCQICGKKQSSRLLAIHHKIPFRISQDNRLSNLISCCINCHGSQDTNEKILENMKVAGYPSRIEDYVPPKWHLWVYGGYARPR